jgi:hypothetical protein
MSAFIKLCRSLTILCVCVLVSSIGYPFVSADWTMIHPTIKPPLDASYAHSLAYDENAICVYAYLRNQETWQYSFGVWSKIPTSSHPNTTMQGAFAYFPPMQCCIYFGGYYGYTNPRDQTWKFDGTTWTQLSPPQHPSARGLNRMVYDSQRQRLVLFGGHSNPEAGPGGPPKIVYGDTWEFDGTTWNDIPTSHTPCPRFYYALAYDKGRGVVVLFGGQCSDGAGCCEPDTATWYDDTWEYDGSDWHQVYTINHPKASGSATWMFYEETIGRVILYDSHWCELWSYDGSNWERVYIQDHPPAGIWELEMAYDTSRQVAVLYGGHIDSANYNETWELSNFVSADVQRYSLPADAASWQPGSAPFVFTAPEFGTGSDGLSLNTVTNTNTFGYWNSEQFAIPHSTDLLRIRWSIRSDKTDRSVVPGFRMRLNDIEGKFSSNLFIESTDTGNCSPNTLGTTYQFYFKNSDGDFPTTFTLSFDVLNFNPLDAPDATLSLSSVVVDTIPPGCLSAPTTERIYTFNYGTEGWDSYSFAPFSAPLFSTLPGSLLITATSNSDNFGYWVNSDMVVIGTTQKLYAITFNVRSDLTDTAACPGIRFRVGSSDAQSGATLDITSSGNGSLSPGTAGRDYTVYYRAAPSSGGTSLVSTWDILNFDPADSNSATLYLDGVTVKSFDLALP